MHTPKSSTSSRPKYRNRAGSSAGVDLKAINARLERWADEIASRFKRGKGKHQHGEEERFEIHHSVFQPPDGVRPISPEELGGLQAGVMAQADFETVVESVRTAISQEVHPSMISQGSSGSYFARDPDGKIVGVFKPKDEEPYAAGNPKWNKWIHRNLFPCFFGRAWYVWKTLRVQSRVTNIAIASSLIFPMSAKRPPTFSTVNYEPTSYPTPMLSGLPQSPSTIPSGTVASSTERRDRCPQNLAVSRSFSRASRMLMSS